MLLTATTVTIPASYYLEDSQTWNEQKKKKKKKNKTGGKKKKKKNLCVEMNWPIMKS